MLDRARFERLVGHHGTPRHRFRVVRQEIRYGFCDNSPGIPKFLHPVLLPTLTL